MKTTLSLTRLRFTFLVALTLAAVLLMNFDRRVIGSSADQAPASSSKAVPGGHHQKLGSAPGNTTVLLAACPSSFTVNDLGDTSDANAGDQICADSNGQCTLRAALEEANALTACTPLTIN